jgi:hypothetical protein
LRREELHMAAPSFRFAVLARRLRPVFAASLMTMCFVVLTAGPVRADCDVLDPACVGETAEGAVDGATETVEDTVDETTGDAEETVDGTVEETVETVEETVESVVGQVDETVDQTVGPGIGPVDGVIGDPSVPGGPDPVSPPTEDPAPPGGGGNGSDGTGPGIDDEPAGAPSGGVARPFALDPITLASAPVGENPPAPSGFLDVLAGPAGEIASRIAFPLALALLVFAFVTFQHRLDGRDPKLALAATSPDVLRFG